MTSSLYQSILESNPTAKNWRQWSQSQQKSITEWLKNKDNQGVAIFLKKSKPQHGWNTVAGELCINQCPQTSINWSNIVNNSGPKFLHHNIIDLQRCIDNSYICTKAGSTSYWIIVFHRSLCSPVKTCFFHVTADNEKKDKKIWTVATMLR